MSAPASHRRGLSPVTVALIMVVLVMIGVFFSFSKKVPFKSHYEVSAVVQTSNLLAKGSVVRIAGIDVGKIVKVGRYRDTNLAKITMRITDEGRPIRKDATLKIRPRLFLEGNFYVDLKPGQPNSPEMPDNGLIPVSATAVPVQLDQFLSSLKTDTRAALQQTLIGLGDGLGSKPTAAEDATQDPEVAGLTGGEALNKTLDTSPDALRGGTKVAQALRGQNPGDLSRVIKGLGDVTSQFAQVDQPLVNLVRDFNRTMAATADNSADLTRTIQKLGVTATRGGTAFASLNQALPSTRTAVQDLTKAMREVPATVDASRPWLNQAKPLLSDAELGGLLDDLSPSLSNLAKLTRTSRTWVPRLDNFSRCMNDVFLPTAMIPVEDGPLSANVPNYKEFWYALVGMSGEGSSFDGNGSMLRLQTIGGAVPLKTGLSSLSKLPAFGNATEPSAGTSPAFNGRQPVLRRDVDCYKNPVPDINGSAANGPGDGSQPSAPAPPLAPNDPDPVKKASSR
jgi:phospholipid/cholesterol/gamma-HCH transport system substrate-binding protein